MQPVGVRFASGSRSSWMAKFEIGLTPESDGLSKMEITATVNQSAEVSLS